jgi:hypothetical protein
MKTACKGRFEDSEDIRKHAVAALNAIALVACLVQLPGRCEKCVADKGDDDFICIFSYRLSPGTVLFDLM